MRKQEDIRGKTHWVEKPNIPWEEKKNCHPAPSCGASRHTATIHSASDIKLLTRDGEQIYNNELAVIIKVAAAAWRHLLEGCELFGLIWDLQLTSASYSNIWLPLMWWHLSMRTGPLRRDTSRQRSSVLISLSAVYENTWAPVTERKRGRV